MSFSRKIRRAADRISAALDRLEARGPLPEVSTVTLALAGNTGSGDRRRATREEAARRAAFRPETITKEIKHYSMGFDNRVGGDALQHDYTQHIVCQTKFDAKELSQ